MFAFNLLTLVGGILSSLGAWFAASVSRKAVVVFSVITAFVAVVAAFLVCMKIIVGALVAALVMPDWIVSWLGMFIPSNYSGVLASILSAKTCRAAYDLARDKIALIGQST